MSEPQFHIADYVVFVVVLVISASIGLFYACTGGRQKTNKEYLMANRNMKVGPVTLSLLVSYMSAISILGYPAEMYTRGTQQWMSVVGMMLACLLSAVIFVPLLYPLKLTSAYEYLELRFKSKAARLTGNVCSVLASVMYMGISLYAPSTALETVTGFPAWATIIIVGSVVTFYTTLGGMKAVIWTDVFQAVVMFAGTIAILIQGCIKVGGIGRVWEINVNGGRIEFFNFNFDPTVRHTTWGLVIAQTFLWTGVYGVNQPSVQRFGALETRREAQIVVLLNIPLVFTWVTMTCLVGLPIYAYYVEKGCDPIANGDISNPNQLVPYFVMEVFNYPGFPGLFVAALFCGTLSSLSSALSSIAANLWEDIFKQKLGSLSDLQQTLFTKGIVCLFGLAAIGMAFLASTFKGQVVQASYSFNGATAGTLLGLFILGAFFPCVNSWGVVIGGIFGLVLPLWISFGAYFSLPKHVTYLPTVTENCTTDLVNSTQLSLNTPETTLSWTTLNVTSAVDNTQITGFNKIYTISYLWLPFLGALSTIIIGLLISACTGFSRKVNPAYLISLYDKFCCCFPQRCRRKFNRCCEYENDFKKEHGPYDEETPGDGCGYVINNSNTRERGLYALVARK